MKYHAVRCDGVIERRSIALRCLLQGSAKVHSVRDVHVPHPVPVMQQPMMAAPMPMPTMTAPMTSTPFVGGNMFGAMSLGTTGFGTFGA